MNDLRLNDLFELDPFDAPLRSWMRPFRGSVADRAPRIRIDVSETADEYVVKAEIPGVRREDIDIRIDGNQVSIGAEVKHEKEQKEGSRVVRSERQFGYASRSFALASPIDDSKADAKYADGVLQLKLPKRAQASGKRLSVA